MNRSGLWMPIAVTVTGIYAISEYGQVPGILPWLSPEAKEILGHLVLYSGLGFLTTRYLWGMGLGLLTALPITLSLCGLLGIFDECHQYFVGARGVEFFDVALDVIGGLAGATAYSTWALLKRLVTKTPRPDFRADVLLRHGVGALTVFVFVLIPATVYWVPLTKYVGDRSSEFSLFAEDVVRVWAPQALSKDARARSGNDNRPAPASPGKVREDVTVKKDATDDLLMFVQVADLLSEKRDATTGPAVGPTTTRGSRIGGRR